MSLPFVLVLPSEQFLPQRHDLPVGELVSLVQKIRLHRHDVIVSFHQPLLQILYFYVQVNVVIADALFAFTTAFLEFYQSGFALLLWGRTYPAFIVGHLLSCLRHNMLHGLFYLAPRTFPYLWRSVNYNAVSTRM